MQTSPALDLLSSGWPSCEFESRARAEVSVVWLWQCGRLSRLSTSQPRTLRQYARISIGMFGPRRPTSLTISNGATPVGLWLGHLLFELPGIVLVSIVITVVFATVSSQFNGIGELFACFVLYGISATLYAFCFSLFLTSQLAAWALYAGISVILFLLYL